MIQQLKKDETRCKLIELFEKNPGKFMDTKEIILALGLSYSAPAYFHVLAILRELSMEGFIARQNNMWQVCWVGSSAKSKIKVVERCMSCGFVQRPSKPVKGVRSCKNCNSGAVWREVEEEEL